MIIRFFAVTQALIEDVDLVVSKDILDPWFLVDFDQAKKTNCLIIDKNTSVGMIERVSITLDETSFCF